MGRKNRIKFTFEYCILERKGQRGESSFCSALGKNFSCEPKYLSLFIFDVEKQPWGVNHLPGEDDVHIIGRFTSQEERVCELYRRHFSLVSQTETSDNA